MDSIRNARKRKGWTQQQLADAVGVKRSVISKYENGAISPSLLMIEKIALALNMSSSDLIGLETYNSPAEFEAARKNALQNCDPDSTEICVIHGQNNIIITDEQQKRINAIYNALDDDDQRQLSKFARLLVDQKKYRDK